jgi:RNA polymerase sigma-70 factor (ECF subfamily)
MRAQRRRAAVLPGIAAGTLGGLVNDRGRDERELVRRCREGSEAAYAELVRTHRPRLYALAYRLTNDPGTAEDIVQETFLAAFKSIDKIEPSPSLVPWLNTIAIRLAGRVASRRSSRPGTSLDRMMDESSAGANPSFDFASLDSMADPQVAAEMAELRRDLDDAIAALPFKYRTAVVLRLVMGLDYAEAAKTLQIPLNTFKSNLLRGTRLLREQLARQLSTDAATGSQGNDGRYTTLDGQPPETPRADGFGDQVAAVPERLARG